MNTKIVICIGIAAAAIATTLPAAAQTKPNPPQYSSPAARAETQQLNKQSLDGTTVSPAALNGETHQPVSTTAMTDGSSVTSARNEEYDRKMQRYNAQQEEYRRQRAAYDQQVKSYQQKLQDYNQARANDDE